MNTANRVAGLPASSAQATQTAVRVSSFTYDLRGRRVETDSQGAPLREYFYLDDAPVAVGE